MNLKLRFQLALFLTLAPAGPLSADFVFVDSSISIDCSTGDYDWPTRSCSGMMGSAFQTLQAALDQALPGDYVFVRGGVYNETIRFNRSGRADTPIRIVGFPGEEVVIDGAGLSADSVVLIQDRSDIQIANLHIRNGGTFGIKIKRSHNIGIFGVEVEHVTHGGIVAEGGSSIAIADCSVHHVNEGGNLHEAISFEGVDTFLVSGCDVHDNGKEGIDAKYNSRNGFITRNRVYRNARTQIYIDAASDIVVNRNQVHDLAGSTGAGIGIGVESSFNPNLFGTHNIRIFNNLIHHNPSGIILWLEGGALPWAKLSGIKIENNTIHNNNKTNWGGIFFINGSRSNFGEGNIIRNNIIWDNTRLNGAKAIRDDAGVAADFAIEHNAFRQGEPASVYGKSALVTQRIGFVGESIADYRLEPDSPALDAGAYSPEVKKDFEGNPRPSGGIFDIGAHEYRIYSDSP